MVGVSKGTAKTGRRKSLRQKETGGRTARTGAAAARTPYHPLLHGRKHKSSFQCPCSGYAYPGAGGKTESYRSLLLSRQQTGRVCSPSWEQRRHWRHHQNTDWDAVRKIYRPSVFPWRRRVRGQRGKNRRFSTEKWEWKLLSLFSWFCMIFITTVMLIYVRSSHAKVLQTQAGDIWGYTYDENAPRSILWLPVEKKLCFYSILIGWNHWVESGFRPFYFTHTSLGCLPMPVFLGISVENSAFGLSGYWAQYQ